MKVIVNTQPYTMTLLLTVLMKRNTDDLNSPDLIFYTINIFLISTVSFSINFQKLMLICWLKNGPHIGKRSCD